MLRMRLTRVGSKKRPAYRVVVADSRAPRDGRHVDIVGHYNPMSKPSTINIDVERAVRWLRNGAEPSERVRVLLRHSGVLKAHEEARLADKRARKEQPAPVRAVRGAAKAAGEAATTTFRIIVGRGAEAVAAGAERVEEAAASTARKTRGRAGTAAKGAKAATKASKTAGAAKGAAKTTRATKSTSTAKSAEKTAARKSATKATKSS